MIVGTWKGVGEVCRQPVPYPPLTLMLALCSFGRRYKALGEELAAAGRIDDVQAMFGHCESFDAGVDPVLAWPLTRVQLRYQVPR